MTQTASLTSIPAAPAVIAERDGRLRRDGAGAPDRAVLHLSAVPDEGAVLCAVRLRLQPADRLCRPAVVRPCAVFRLGELCRRASRQGRHHPDPLLGREVACHSAAAALARACDPRRHAGRGGARADRRLARDPPAGHLFRHDHARAGADDVLLRRAGAVHRRRGRHPGGAARHLFGVDQSRRSKQHVLCWCWRSFLAAFC